MRNVSADTDMLPKVFDLQPANCDAVAGERVSAFRQIYETKANPWIKEDGLKPLQLDSYYTQSDPERLLPRRHSASGHGSDLGDATATSLAFLRHVIQNYSVDTMIDVPCGDVNWQLETRATDALSGYVGLDIVASVAAFNERRFAHHSNKRFAAWDFAQCPLPQLRNASGTFAVDLVHSRDVFQHMRPASALRAIHHVVDSGARLFVATTFGPVGSRAAVLPPPTFAPQWPPIYRAPPARQSRQTTSRAKHRSILGRRAAEDGAAAAEIGDSPTVLSEGGFAHVNLHARPFVLPPPQACVPSHPRIEPDLTCLYVLSAEWKLAWQRRRRRCGQACEPQRTP